MSITCPNCHTHFAIAKEQIGTQGRKVKCSKCQHIWYQKLDFLNVSPKYIQNKEQTSIPPSNEAITNKLNAQIYPVYPGQASNVASLLAIKTAASYNIVSILLINLIFLLLFLLFHDRFVPLLASLKSQDNKVNIENIQINKAIASNQLKISYRITNNDKDYIVIPLIRIQILDKYQIAVKTYIMNQKNIKLFPKQYIDINTTLNDLPISGNKVNIALGNSLDFILQ